MIWWTSLMTLFKSDMFKCSTFWGTGIVVGGRRCEWERGRLVRSLEVDLVRYNERRCLVSPGRAVPQPNQATTFCEAASSVEPCGEISSPRALRCRPGYSR